MKKVRSDGTFYYYYHKKKRGRPKKRGRKKKKVKLTGHRGAKRHEFRIVRCVDKKQRSVIGGYLTLDDALLAKEKLDAANARVLVPKKYTNNQRKSDDLVDYVSEYLLLQRASDSGDTTTLLRNEYGKFVEHISLSEKWKIYDKFPCLVEETFWVYGYDHIKDRKNTRWIMENLIDQFSEESFVRIYVYGNKLIIRYDCDFNFVNCKSLQDAIRLYNKLEELYHKDKTVIFTGLVERYSERALDTAEMIRKKTKWPDHKIFRSTTRR